MLDAARDLLEQATEVAAAQTPDLRITATVSRAGAVTSLLEAARLLRGGP